MKKHLLLSLAALSLAATGAYAADNATTKTPASSSGSAAMPGNPPEEKDWTLDEARKRAHFNAERANKYAEKLDKMTNEDWAQHEKERHARLDKLHNMTPEEKAAYFKNREERREAEYNSASKTDARPTETKQ